MVRHGGAVVPGCMGLWGLAMLLGGGSGLQDWALLIAAAGICTMSRLSVRVQR